jgi:hypothetical protein
MGSQKWLSRMVKKNVRYIFYKYNNTNNNEFTSIVCNNTEGYCNSRFPEAHEFEIQYMKRLGDDRYLAEKTWPRIKKMSI